MYQADDYAVNEEEYVNDLSDIEVFTTIWFSPRRVFKFIQATDYRKYSFLILYLFGVTKALDRAMDKGMGDNLSVVGIVIAALTLGGLLGWISLYIYSALVGWMGTWINGRAGTNEIFRIFTYSSIPSICSLFFYVMLIIIFGKDIFMSDDSVISVTESVFVLFLTLPILGLSLWSLILMVIGLSEIQNFSIGKSLLNAFLPVIIFLIFVLFIVLLMGL